MKTLVGKFHSKVDIVEALNQDIVGDTFYWNESKYSKMKSWTNWAFSQAFYQRGILRCKICIKDSIQLHSIINLWGRANQGENSFLRE